jgi:hypothetical protein
MCWRAGVRVVGLGALEFLGERRQFGRGDGLLDQGKQFTLL